MCTAVILRRPGHDWPILFAGNRDEMADRPWRPPARHWPDRPEVTAGQDILAGGSWLGVNDHGVLAAVLNRKGSLGPAADKRSRGELVLEALDHADAKDAAEALSHLDPAAYRSFNLVIADSRDAFWLRNLGAGAERVEAFGLPEGVSMITAFDRNDSSSSAKVRRYLPRFEAAKAPDPENGNWEAWRKIMASRDDGGDPGPEAGMTLSLASGFATVSSSLIGLPNPETGAPPEPRKAVWLFAAGPPDLSAYLPVAL
jgi:uncharacterized protein with NRDE domain